MNKNQRPQKQTRIFALTVGRSVYVGKTTSRDLAAVYRNHTRGRCGRTADTIIASGLDVQFFLLEMIDANHFLAYRHIVAWVRVFADAGYTILNPPGTLADAAELYPATQTLVRLFCYEPLEGILERTHIPSPGSGKKKAAEAETDEAPDKLSETKLTVRLAPEEKEAFAAFAMSLGLTQRNALLYLMRLHSGSGQSVDDAVLKTQQRLSRAASKLQEENHRLRKQIERLKASPENLAPKMTQRFREAQAGIEAYFHDIVPQPQGDPLPRMGYKRFQKTYSAPHRFDYRKFFDVYTFTPVAILYGYANPPVHFWVGRTEDGTPCKIRVYEKLDFCGMSPLHPKFSISGVQWLIRTRTAADGAEDLVFALPIIAAPKSKPAHPAAADRKPSLDEKIAAASKKM